MFNFLTCRDKLFPESTVRNVTYQILQGLAFMHKHGILKTNYKNKLHLINLLILYIWLFEDEPWFHQSLVTLLTVQCPFKVDYRVNVLITQCLDSRANRNVNASVF